MNRNVTIVVIILVLVLIAGYMVWLRNKYQPAQLPAVYKEKEVMVAPAKEATSSDGQATASMQIKTSTDSSSNK